MISNFIFFQSSCADSAVVFLKSYAEELGLEFEVYYAVEKKPIVLMTWRGSEPDLPTVLLMSHVDVVPVYPVSSRSERYNH